VTSQWNSAASGHRHNHHHHQHHTTALITELDRKKLKSVTILQSYQQERGCVMHFARLANILLNAERRRKCARQSRSCFCQIFTDLKKVFRSRTQQQTFLNLVINNTATP